MDNPKITSWTIAKGVCQGILLTILILVVVIPIILFILAVFGIVLFI